MTSYIKISDLFSRFRKSQTLADIESGKDPARAMSPGGIRDVPENMRHMIPQFYGGIIGAEVLPGIAQAINLATLFWIWWQAPAHRRIVYRPRPDTAAHLARVNLGFMPDRPPDCWTNGAMVIEATDPARPLVADWSCIAAYFIQDQTGAWRYFFIGLQWPDGIDIWGVKADFGHLNTHLARDGAFVDLPYMTDDMAPGPGRAGTSPAAKLALIKYIFAASYYIDAGRFDTTRHPGPTVRDGRGKPVKRHGHNQNYWSYEDLAGFSKPTGDQPADTRGPMDKSGLALEPTIVSPHIRRVGEKIVIVDAYDSHRWRRHETLGEKKTI